MVPRKIFLLDIKTIHRVPAPSKWQAATPAAGADDAPKLAPGLPATHCRSAIQDRQAMGQHPLSQRGFS
jgi:hypothetical protein